MSDAMRTVKLTDEQADRIYAVLESAETRFVARLLQEFLTRNTLDRKRAWSEVHRIAEVDSLTEECFVSYATNEIIVKKKSEQKPGGTKTWEMVEDE